jgi:alpha-beta hydrolase superfamily lysophospholipase
MSNATIILTLGLLALALWLGVNLAHAAWIGVRRGRWERRIRRGPDGVASDATAFTCGTGRDAVLLVHGFADTASVFAGMAVALAAHGLTCRVMRLPGAGEPLPVAARQTLDGWLAAIREEAVTLRRSHRRVWLAGHSMGGALALLAQLNDPALADGLVLFAPLFDVSPARSPLVHPRIWFRIAQMLLPLSRTFESCFPVNVLTADGAAIAYQRDRFIPFATYRGLFDLTARLRGRAAELRVPLFAVLVPGDRVVNTDAAHAWLVGCNLPRLHSEMIEACGHAIPLEHRILPDLCRRIVGFMQEG